MKENAKRYPLDLRARSYAYLERPNPAILSLFRRHVSHLDTPRVLDIGCGCGVNAHEILRLTPAAEITGIEPDPAAAEEASKICRHVFRGDLQAWLDQASEREFDLVMMSDVLEHVADPVEVLSSLVGTLSSDTTLWIVSVPNFGVWYNRLRTLVGRFDYTWSGLYDRTHLRFFTRRSLRRLLSYCGLEVLEDRCSPSLVQSLAPLLRTRFEDDVSRGKHLALFESRSFQFYRRLIEPVETAICGIWPGLLGFQIVVIARRKGVSAARATVSRS